MKTTVPSVDKKKMTTQDRNAVVRSDAMWRKILTADQFFVLREKGTEIPHTGELLHENRHGEYVCAGCGQRLFVSSAKYDDGCGWPAFSAVADDASVITQKDTSHFMVRTEVLCSACKGHLGHLFDDGPGPDGNHFCINSAALQFRKK